MAVLTRDDNRFPLDGSNVAVALATVSLTANVVGQITVFAHFRRTLLIGNPHATAYLRLAMTVGTGLTDSVWSLSVRPQGSVVIDGAYAQAEWWGFCSANLTVPYQVG